MSITYFNSRLRIDLVIGLVCIFTISLYYLSSPETITELSKEHGLVEDLSALCYFVAVILCLVAIAQKKGRYFAWIWLVLTFLFLGEETNWLQNYLEYDIPFYEQLASTEKSEFALHNFSFIDGTGNNFQNEDGSLNFAPKNFLKAQSLFKLGFFLYFFLLPIVMLRKEIGEFFTRMGIPPFSLSTWIMNWSVIALITCVAIWIRMHGGEKQPYGELRELFYAMFILYHITGFFLTKSAAKPAHDELTDGLPA